MKKYILVLDLLSFEVVWTHTNTRQDCVRSWRTFHFGSLFFGHCSWTSEVNSEILVLKRELMHEGAGIAVQLVGSGFTFVGCRDWGWSENIAWAGPPAGITNESEGGSEPLCSWSAVRSWRKIASVCCGRGTCAPEWELSGTCCQINRVCYYWYQLSWLAQHIIS